MAFGQQHPSGRFCSSVSFQTSPFERVYPLKESVQPVKIFLKLSKMRKIEKIIRKFGKILCSNATSGWNTLIFCCWIVGSKENKIISKIIISEEEFIAVDSHTCTSVLLTNNSLKFSVKLWSHNNEHGLIPLEKSEEPYLVEKT